MIQFWQMKKIFILLGFLLLISCSEKQTLNVQIGVYIPANAEIIILSPNLGRFSEDLADNLFLNSGNFNLKTSLKEELGFIDQLNFKNQTVISFSDLSAEKLNYVLTTKADSTFIQLDSIKNKSLETISENGIEYQRIQINDWQLLKYESGSLVILTNSKKLLFSILNEEDRLEDADFQNTLKATDPNKTSLIARQKDYLPEIDSFFEVFGFPAFSKLSKWISMDLEITPDEIKANGIAIGNSNDLIGIFRSNSARPIEAVQICPRNFTNLMAFSFEDFKKFHEKLMTYRGDSTSATYPEVLNNSRELALFEIDSEKVFTINVREIEEAKENLAGLGIPSETYRDIEIFELENKVVFNSLIPELITLDSLNYFTIINHFILFSERPKALKEVISAYQNSAVLSNTPHYTELMSKLSSESSMLFLAQPKNLWQALNNSENTSKKLNFQKNSLAALQLIKDEGFAHLHAVFSNQQSSAITANGVKQTSAIKTPGKIYTNPVFFKNHRTDQMDIVVQDENNVLYLISNKGNIFWQKQLDSRIMGPVHQVDLFRNGNKQLAFSTAYNLHVIDRDGNRVKPFPIKFNDPLTQPVSVFDYDNNRNYRFVLTQDKRIYMIGPKGKAIKGFDFEKAASKIILPPKHIRLGTKDYILIAEESGKMNILSRQGNIRVPVDENIDFSENQWYGYKGDFVSTAPTENLISIDQSGKVTMENKDLAENNRIAAEDNLLVYLNENKLNIGAITVDLDFGLYTNPQLFKIKNKYLIGITDTQAKKVYVFDDSGELLDGFPVYGNSGIDISNADIDTKLELVVKGEENEILIYKF